MVGRVSSLTTALIKLYAPHETPRFRLRNSPRRGKGGAAASVMRVFCHLCSVGDSSVRKVILGLESCSSQTTDDRVAFRQEWQLVNGFSDDAGCQSQVAADAAIDR